MPLTKPPVKNPWADAGDKVEPTGAELSTGWPLSNIPPSRQRFNWILNFLANGVRYLTRRGIADHDILEPYEPGDKCRATDGFTYSAKLQNINKLPQSNTAEWELWAFTKSQLDNIINGTDYKQSVKFTTIANILLTGLGTQAGGDWPAALTAGDRLLIKNQTAGAENGIWIAAVGAWTRATDADTGAELNSGAIIPVESGALNADTNWQLTTDGTVVIGTTVLTFIDMRFIGAGYMLLRDEKASGTAAGSSVITAMPTGQTRALNTVAANTIAGASLAANQIILPTGTYRIRGSAPANGNLHRIFLYNITDASVMILGGNENCLQTISVTNSDPIWTTATLVGRIVIASAKTFELRHYVSEAVASNGLGQTIGNAGFNEVYSQIEITKES